MKYEPSTLLLLLVGATSAAPLTYAGNPSIPVRVLRGREVPQEHSHEKFLTSVRASLNVNNPAGIVDPVFGLLGDAAAAAGLGKLTDVECLQQSTADQAFTNAKAAGDITGMTNALAYRALERNTGQVGLKSNACTSVTAVNSEIAAISQHQDPASAGAAATNKAVVLELAKQIDSIGGNASVALDTGTFAPGTIGDPTGAGNTCDTQNDAQGCIFTENKLVLDATPAEIAAAIAGGSGAGPSPVASSAANVAAVASSAVAAVVSPCSATSTTTIMMTSTITAGAATSAISPASCTAAVTSGTNVQTFTGSLGGPPPPVISSAGARPFSVDGNTFVNAGAAIQRSCSIQHNACADAANSGALAGGVGQCDTQETSCNALISSKIKRAALDFGSCSDPAILFEFGLDGRTQQAFIAANQVDFDHGSALNIGVIASFICQRFQSPCNAGADAIAACATAQTAAAAQTGQAAADAFNAALGVSATPSSTSSAATTSSPAVVATTTSAAIASSACQSIMTVTMMTTVTVSPNAATPSTTTTTSSSLPVASGTNVQTFAGALGGIGAPPVIETGGSRPFSTDNATFVNAAAALQRSCSVQHNQCADAANAGTLTGGEAQCETQQTACNAAAGL